MKTYREKEDNIHRNWYLIDAEDKVLGRLATKVASILRGKNKVCYDQSQDLGDYVIVVNAEKVKVTGKKSEQKIYRYHTHYPGSLKEVPYKVLMQKKPEIIIEKAVKGMLPHNKLNRSIIKKLKVYRGEQHPHSEQEVIPVK